MATKKNRRSFLITIVIIAVLAFTKVMLSPLGNLDDLWNYSFSKGISMGYIPYSDINLIYTPLFFMVFSLPLMISRSYFMYRITSSVFLTVTSLLFGRIVSRRTNNYWGLISSCILIVFTDIFTYNGLILLFSIIIYMVLCSDISHMKSFVLGVIGALSILSRQTTGTFIALFILMVLLSNKPIYRKVMLYLAGGLSVMIPFAAYLLFIRSFASFWDYCLFSLLSFGGNNGLFLPNSLLFLGIAAAGAVCDIVLIKKNGLNEYIYHLCLGICILTIGIPIIDMMHLIYAGIWFLFPVIKIISDVNKDRISDTVLKVIAAITAVYILVAGISGLSGTVLDHEHKELKLVPIPSDIFHDNMEVGRICNEYRDEGKRVIVFSSSSAIFSMMNEEYNAPYDVFNNGNFGMINPLFYVEEACANTNTVIVIPENYAEENWQNPDGVFEYVDEHMNPVQRYGVYIWYEHP